MENLSRLHIALAEAALGISALPPLLKTGTSPGLPHVGGCRGKPKEKPKFFRGSPEKKGRKKRVGDEILLQVSSILVLDSEHPAVSHTVAVSLLPNR